MATGTATCWTCAHRPGLQPVDGWPGRRVLCLHLLTPTSAFHLWPWTPHCPGCTPRKQFSLLRLEGRSAPGQLSALLSRHCLLCTPSSGSPLRLEPRLLVPRLGAELTRRGHVPALPPPGPWGRARCRAALDPDLRGRVPRIIWGGRPDWRLEAFDESPLSLFSHSSESL